MAGVGYGVRAAAGEVRRRIPGGVGGDPQGGSDGGPARVCRASCDWPLHLFFIKKKKRAPLSSIQGAAGAAHPPAAATASALDFALTISSNSFSLQYGVRHICAEETARRGQVLYIASMRSRAIHSFDAVTCYT
eukprot:scaffold16614_cov121-Isochrysis_galbana.AAC.1